MARKLLVYIYAMLKSGELYDDNLDVTDTENRKAEKLEAARKTVEHRSKTSLQIHRKDKDKGSPAVTVVPILKPEIDIEKPAEPALLKKRGRPRKVVENNSHIAGQRLSAKTG